MRRVAFTVFFTCVVHYYWYYSHHATRACNSMYVIYSFRRRVRPLADPTSAFHQSRRRPSAKSTSTNRKSTHTPDDRFDVRVTARVSEAG